MIGVAVVGTGFGQKVHIPAFQAHHNTKIVAVYHRDINKAKTKLGWSPTRGIEVMVADTLAALR